jgi:TonB family protein
MREPNLNRTIKISFALHITMLLIIFVFLKQRDRIIVPSPYTVTLVNPNVLKWTDRVKYATPSHSSSEYTVQSNTSKGKTKDPNRDHEIVEDKIALLAAKKKVEKIVKLRSSISSVISLKASRDTAVAHPEQDNTPSGQATLFDEYYAKIRKEIWQQWVFPETGKRDLETIISIRILKDGRIINNRIEKSSGNPLFDRSAIKALAKASPLPAPPYEMDVGVRFYP